MKKMTPQQFETLSNQGYTHIPLTREVLADFDTPLSIYQKLTQAQARNSYLFESVQGGEKWGRYSIIGLPCRDHIQVFGHQVECVTEGVVVSSENSPDPLAWIEHYQSQFKMPEIQGLPKFCGGLVGYFSYDTVRYIEPRLEQGNKPDALKTPDILLLVSKEVVVFDNLANKLFVIVYGDTASENAYKKAAIRLDELVGTISAHLQPATTVHISPPITEGDFVSGFTQEGFESAVKRIKEYIVEGDVMQVVLSQRLSIPFKSEPIDLYRALRCLNPSPYMYFMDFGGFQVVGSSPEILVRSEGGVVTVRPIAGTRKRGQSEKEDVALEQELLADPKECAEHLMLIDLGRNDVGRVSQVGSVELTENMLVERYSHVMHIVSNVVGDVKAGMTAMDVLRATFPAGTVSGAPKVRAMEIIDELEPVKRGVYSGAVGYVGWNGNMDTAIAIRTAVIKDGVLTIQAGAGIVADSIPTAEWEETMSKGRAIFQAVAMAVAGLNAGQGA